MICIPPQRDFQSFTHVCDKTLVAICTVGYLAELELQAAAICNSCRLHKSTLVSAVNAPNVTKRSPSDSETLSLTIKC